MSHHRRQRAQDAENGAMLQRIRHERGEEIHERAPGETRDRERLDGESGPGRVDGLDDGGQEEGVGEELEIGGEIHEAEDPDFPVSERGEDVGALEGLGRGRGGFALGAGAAGEELLALGGGEVPCGGGRVGEEEPAEDPETD